MASQPERPAEDERDKPVIASIPKEWGKNLRACIVCHLLKTFEMARQPQQNNIDGQLACPKNTIYRPATVCPFYYSHLLLTYL